MTQRKMYQDVESKLDNETIANVLKLEMVRWLWRAVLSDATCKQRKDRKQIT